MLFSKPEGIVLSFLPNDGLTTQRHLAGPYPSLEPYHSCPQRGAQSEAHQESLCQQATLFWKKILSFFIYSWKSGTLDLQNSAQPSWTSPCWRWFYLCKPRPLHPWPSSPWLTLPEEHLVTWVKFKITWRDRNRSTWLSPIGSSVDLSSSSFPGSRAATTSGS